MLILGGFTEKSDFQGGGFIKKQYTGGNCLKRGEDWTFADLRGAWKKRGEGKRGWFFWCGRGDTTMQTMTPLPTMISVKVLSTPIWLFSKKHPLLHYKLILLFQRQRFLAVFLLMGENLQNFDNFITLSSMHLKDLIDFFQKMVDRLIGFGDTVGKTLKVKILLSHPKNTENLYFQGLRLS